MISLRIKKFSLSKFKFLFIVEECFSVEKSRSEWDLVPGKNNGKLVDLLVILEWHKYRFIVLLFLNISVFSGFLWFHLKTFIKCV